MLYTTQGTHHKSNGSTVTVLTSNANTSTKRQHQQRQHPPTSSIMRNRTIPFLYPLASRNMPPKKGMNRFGTEIADITLPYFVALKCSLGSCSQQPQARTQAGMAQNGSGRIRHPQHAANHVRRSPLVEEERGDKAKSQIARGEAPKHAAFNLLCRGVNTTFVVAVLSYLPPTISSLPLLQPGRELNLRTSVSDARP